MKAFVQGTDRRRRPCTYYTEPPLTPRNPAQHCLPYFGLTAGFVTPVAAALGSLVAALPETVTVSLIDTDASILATAELEISTLSFALDPCAGAVTDTVGFDPSALHALIALLENAGHDATDPSVLSAVDSAYGVYVDSILGSTAPMYWTFRVDGTDSWVGVFDHKLTAGEDIAFVKTEYIPAPTPEPGFVHPASGLPLQPVDVDGALGVIAAAFAGTSSDWQVLDMARYGLADQTGRDAWLSAAYDRLTARRVSATDLELTALILTGLGIDARSIVVDGMSMDLMARIASTPGLDTYGLIFGLAAFDSAGYPDSTGASITRLRGAGLLDARLPDGGWSWAPTEAMSDTDTTAMAISVLARYAADNPDVAASAYCRAGPPVFLAGPGRNHGEQQCDCDDADRTGCNRCRRGKRRPVCQSGR
jgi:hypothetical protein